MARRKKNTELIPVGANPVDFFGLADEAVNLRSQGLSYIKITNILNKNNQDKLKRYTLPVQCVCEWFSKHQQFTDETRSKEIINTYNEHKKLLGITERQIQMAQLFLDDYEQEISAYSEDGRLDELYSKVRSTSLDLEKFIARKQAILTQMQVIQDKVYNLTLLSDINQSLLASLKRKDPELFDEITKEITNNPVILMSYEKIKDFSENL